MTYGSLFTGAGGADLGLHKAGFSPLWFCEKDRQCRDVLRFHWPEITCYEDVTTFPAEDVPCPDVLWMSPPCQDLSVAGKRAGLAGGRSGLFYDAVRIAESLRGRGLRWVLMEQVPGLFSSNGGGDFREVLHAFRELGVSVGWRVLDSQFFGVPHRRRRVFFAVDLTGRRAAEVLSLGEGLRGDSAANGAFGANDDSEADESYPIGFYGRNGGIQSLTAMVDKTPCLTSSNPICVLHNGRLRWCTGLEHDRLQGFPDDHTRYAIRPNGDKYEVATAGRVRMTGNAVSPVVSEWLGRNLWSLPLQGKNEEGLDERN